MLPPKYTEQDLANLEIANNAYQQLLHQLTELELALDELLAALKPPTGVPEPDHSS